MASDSTHGPTDAVRALAFVLMAVDHSAIYLVGNPSVAMAMRVAGRLAFPMFAVLSAAALCRTSSVRAYATRLLALAGVSQIAWATLDPAVAASRLNVVFTLLAGVIVLAAGRSGRWSWLAWGSAVAVAVAWASGGSDPLSALEFGSVGVACVPLAALVGSGLRGSSAAGASASAAWAASAAAGQGAWWQVAGGLGLPLSSLLWSAPFPRMPRWVSYGFYPAHLLVIAGIVWVLGR